jgi:hypothetical protein
MADKESIEEFAKKIGEAAQSEIKTGVVRPGDTIIVGFSRRISEQENHEIQDRLHFFLPDVRLVVFPEVEGIRVYRPDGEGMLCLLLGKAEAGMLSRWKLNMPVS